MFLPFKLDITIRRLHPYLGGGLHFNRRILKHGLAVRVRVTCGASGFWLNQVISEFFDFLALPVSQLLLPRSLSLWPFQLRFHIRVFSSHVVKLRHEDGVVANCQYCFFLAMVFKWFLLWSLCVHFYRLRSFWVVFLVHERLTYICLKRLIWINSQVVLICHIACENSHRRSGHLWCLFLYIVLLLHCYLWRFNVLDRDLFLLGDRYRHH